MEDKKDIKNEILELVKDILLAVVIALVILCFINPVLIKQESMQPNFDDGDYVIVSTRSYDLFSEPKRGDVIVFNSSLKQSNGKDKKLIKRIIGLPGETIEIIDSVIYINGTEINEPYIKEAGFSGDLQQTVIKDDEVFCMGDNRRVSLDSREIGTIKLDDVCGRVVLRLFPFKKMERIKRISYE